MITPLLVWWGLIIAYPLVRVVLISLTNSSPITGSDSFVGLANFKNIFDGGLLGAPELSTVEFTAIFAVCSTVLEMVIGCAIALLLDRMRRCRWILGIIMAPWAISEIVTATAGTWLFNQQFGLVDAVFNLVAGVKPVWLSSPTLARLALIIMNSWEYMPLACLFILTGLTNVPSDLVEQSKVDGASEVGTYRNVHWPLTRPIVLGIATFITAINLVAFGLPYAMTQGGPGTSTYLVSYEVYQLAIPGLQYGSGAAVGVVTLVMVLIVAAVGAVVVSRAERKIGAG